MKKLPITLAGMAMVLLARGQALAVDAAEACTGSFLVGIFIGFCVLLVVIQLLPTLMLLGGAAKGMFGRSAGRKLGQGV